MRRFCAKAAGLFIAMNAGVVLAAPLDLPSAPGRTIETVRKLPPGGWADLGSPAADPEWGRARGRTWTSTMPYAASLGGAFLYGEGIHGWSNPKNGRYMDDLWLYDVNGHSWVNLHPGTDVRSPPEIVLNDDGFEALPNGEPVPIAIAVHGYEMVTWDSRRQLMYTVPNHHSYVKGALPTIAGFRDETRNRQNYRQASPWMFDPWNRKWHRLRTVTPSPKTGYGDVLLYLPVSRTVFHYRNRDVNIYDPETNRWSAVRPAGPRPPFGIDPVACYDPARNRIYIGGGSYPVAPGNNALWIFDVAKNRWIDPQPSGSPGGNSFSTNIAILNCDTGNDRVVLIRHGSTSTGVYVYDPVKNAWRDRVEPLPASFPEKQASSGFYEPRLGVHYVFSAGDSRDNGRITVHRLSR